ncbi:hypothetical protein ID866_8629 [Astraeus odoratus]|nr:hypothetical protein ID866_8629 [Astraeus odoratus]
MLPITEFQAAFCGIATVAATLGYAYSRKVTRPTPPPDDPRADVDAGSLEERSLKRKLDDSDSGETCADQQERPMKRSKTPPTEQHGEDEDEWEVIVAPPSYEEATASPREKTPERPRSPDHHATTCAPDATPTREKTPEPVVGSEVVCEQTQKPSEPEHRTPQSSSPRDEIKAVPTPSATPPPKAIEVKSPRISDAFSTFANSGSPFASYSSPNGISPFGVAGQKEKATPAWRHIKQHSEITTDKPSNMPTRSPNDVAAVTTESSPALESAQSRAKQLSSYATGEEDEVVIAELKAAKLFIKRGQKEFTSGMFGHVKVLSCKADPSGNEAEKDADGVQNRSKTQSKTRTRLRKSPHLAKP